VRFGLYERVDGVGVVGSGVGMRVSRGWVRSFWWDSFDLLMGAALSETSESAFIPILVTTNSLFSRRNLVKPPFLSSFKLTGRTGFLGPGQPTADTRASQLGLGLGAKTPDVTGYAQFNSDELGSAEGRIRELRLLRLGLNRAIALLQKLDHSCL
jgi:hypothetical protein